MRSALVMAGVTMLCACPPPPPGPRPVSPTPISQLPPDAAPIPPPLAPLPDDAGRALAKLADACDAKDYAALRPLVLATVTVEIDRKPVAADAAIAEWRASPAMLDEIATSIRSGCELVPGDADQLVCPAQSRANDNSLVVVFQKSHGAWLVTQALYAD